MSIGFQVGSALQAVGKQIRARFFAENFGLQPNQFGLLSYIAKEKEVIQTELATLLDKDKSAILREMDVLEEKGLIQRVNDAADRRKKFVILTQEGKNVLKRGNIMLDKLMNELLDGLPEAEIETFKKVLIHLEAKAKH